MVVLVAMGVRVVVKVTYVGIVFVQLLSHD